MLFRFASQSRDPFRRLRRTLRRKNIAFQNPLFGAIIFARIISHPYLSGSRRNSSLVRRLFLIDDAFMIWLIARRGAI